MPATVASTTVLAVDGNSLAHRAFHSTRGDGDAGLHAVTGAVVSMIASTLPHGPYDGIVVAFDHPVNTRRAEFPEYKAQRSPTDPRLRTALEALRDHLTACGWQVERSDGAEADDLLAATVDGCLERSWRCDLLSSDKDLIALVDDGVRLLRPRARFADLLVEDVAAVRERYGIEPALYPDLAALRGDASDGLKGVDGVGAKTAARLVRDHGGVVGVYAALGDLPPALEVALRAARERVERNRLLMSPLPHLRVDPAPAVAAGIDVERAEAVLVELGEHTAARRLRRAVDHPLPPLPPPPAEPPPADPPPWHAVGSESDRAPRPPAAPHGDQAALF